METFVTSEFMNKLNTKYKILIQVEQTSPMAEFTQNVRY